jgi:hypothetical protein
LGRDGIRRLCRVQVEKVNIIDVLNNEYYGIDDAQVVVGGGECGYGEEGVC